MMWIQSILMICILLWKYDGILFEKNKDLLNCVISMDTYGWLKFDYKYILTRKRERELNVPPIDWQK
jgi:hypothetical protein